MSKELTNLFSKKVNKQDFSKIKISLASPEKIRSWSFCLRFLISKKLLDKQKHFFQFHKNKNLLKNNSGAFLTVHF